MVSVSNGGIDTIAPLVSFRGLMDGDTVSGTFDLEVNAVDNDQVQLVSVFIDRWPVLISSRAPYVVNVDTTRYQDQAGKASLKLEAWAYDRSNNLGKAKPITVLVDNQPNATPAKPDPARVPDSHPATGSEAAIPSASAVLAPSAAQTTGSGTQRQSEPAGSPPKTAHSAALPAGLGAPDIAGTSHESVRMASVPHSTAPEFPASQSTRELQPAGTRPVRIASRDHHTAPELVAGAIPTASAAVAPRTEVPQVPAQPAEKRVSNRLYVSLAPPSKALAPAKPAAAVPVRVKRVARRPAPAVRPAPAARVVAPKRVADSHRTLSQKPGEPLLFAWDPTSKPNADGRYEMRVFRGRTTPWRPERIYNVRAGETLQGIARTCHVTPRSILVASGLSERARIRGDMTLHVPGTFDVILNDQKVAFDVAPRIDHGMPLAPFRQIMEHSGGVVLWFEETQSVRGTNERVDVQLKIGDRNAVVNNKPVVLDKAPFIDSGRTMVPIRFVEEALDLKAEYDARSGSIYLVKK